MARSEVERAASPFYVEPAGGRLYIPTDYFGTVSTDSCLLTTIHPCVRLLLVRLDIESIVSCS